MFYNLVINEYLQTFIDIYSEIIKINVNEN